MSSLVTNIVFMSYNYSSVWTEGIVQLVIKVIRNIHFALLHRYEKLSSKCVSDLPFICCRALFICFNFKSRDEFIQPIRDVLIILRKCSICWQNVVLGENIPLCEGFLVANSKRRT